ncbi:MAG: tetrahydromethanopterin S-methyltransferase subunit H [Candidatus Hecatellaceae archaeon]|nr:MAG: tetrahydromethanopterin S-methyltransferase subunit H [Candidatus Hecatellales archaeon]
MFRFQREQKIVEVGKVKFGGQPGEYPTVLAGTIFYGGHKIVSDPHKGEFDREKAEALIKRQEELSDTTMLPHVVQVFAEAPDAMIRYIDFVTSITDAPIIIDSTDAVTRAKGAKYVREVGLGDKSIYNSINVSLTGDEIEALRETKIPAIVLAFNPKDQASVKGRMDVLTTGAGILQDGLLKIAQEFTDKILLDVAVTALGMGTGPSEMATYVMKTKFGLPVGCGIHNAVSAWVWLKRYKKQVAEGREAFRICDVASAVIHIMCGGDFVLYGPIENAPYAFPLVAFTNCVVAEAVSVEAETKPVEEHPFNKLVGK